LIEGDLFPRVCGSAVDGGDAFLEVHAAFNRAEHLVTRAENALEKLEFFREQFVNPLVRRILAVEKLTTTTSCFCP